MLFRDTFCYSGAFLRSACLCKEEKLEFRCTYCRQTECPRTHSKCLQTLFYEKPDRQIKELRKTETRDQASQRGRELKLQKKG